MSTEELDNLINATCWICRPINQENKVEAIRFLTEEGVSISAAQVNHLLVLVFSLPYHSAAALYASVALFGYHLGLLLFPYIYDYTRILILDT